MSRHWTVRSAFQHLPPQGNGPPPEGDTLRMARVKNTTKHRKPRITGGVDTHSKFHHAAVTLLNGRRLADARFPATSAGYRQLLAWLSSFGRLVAVGVEGTNSYGAGLTRHLTEHGIQVVEVTYPDRRERSNRGKSDALDAYSAADAAANGRAKATPKAGTGAVEGIRMLHSSRAGAIKARTAAINELRALLITSPARLREQLQPLSTTELIKSVTRLKMTQNTDIVEKTAKIALRSLARRCQQLSTEITDLETQIHDLIQTVCPQLLELHGVGLETAAQLLITAGDNPDRINTPAEFATLCGTAPIPASSGNTNKHRLSRGGDRQANRALYIIALTRLATCPRTRAYRDRRTSEGLSTREIIRCLKRYIARHIHKVLITSMNTTPAGRSSALDKP